jgi:hypothetical protein
VIGRLVKAWRATRVQEATWLVLHSVGDNRKIQIRTRSVAAVIQQSESPPRALVMVDGVAVAVAESAETVTAMLGGTTTAAPEPPARPPRTGTRPVDPTRERFDAETQDAIDRMLDRMLRSNIASNEDVN